MPGSHLPYPLEIRQQMVELVRAGRTSQELADEFESTAESIRNWVKQAERDEDQRSDCLSTDEKQELARLPSENKQLRLERGGCIVSFARGIQHDKTIFENHANHYIW